MLSLGDRLRISAHDQQAAGYIDALEMWGRTVCDNLLLPSNPFHQEAAAIFKDITTNEGAMVIPFPRLTGAEHGAV